LLILKIKELFVIDRFCKKVNKFILCFWSFLGFFCHLIKNCC